MDKNILDVNLTRRTFLNRGTLATLGMAMALERGLRIASAWGTPIPTPAFNPRILHDLPALRTLMNNNPDVVSVQKQLLQCLTTSPLNQLASSTVTNNAAALTPYQTDLLAASIVATQNQTIFANVMRAAITGEVVRSDVQNTTFHTINAYFQSHPAVQRLISAAAQLQSSQAKLSSAVHQAVRAINNPPAATMYSADADS